MDEEIRELASPLWRWFIYELQRKPKLRIVQDPPLLPQEAMKENRLTRKIQQSIADEYGTQVCLFKIHGGPHQKQGIPDIIGCLRGQFFGLEIKVPERRNKVTILQQHALRRIDRAGGIAAVVTSAEEALEALDGGQGKKTRKGKKDS